MRRVCWSIFFLVLWSGASRAGQYDGTYDAVSTLNPSCEVTLRLVVSGESVSGMVTFTGGGNHPVKTPIAGQSFAQNETYGRFIDGTFSGDVLSGTVYGRCGKLPYQAKKAS